MATLAYGDLVPKTAAGKIFTVAYVICDIGMFVAVVAGPRRAHRSQGAQGLMWALSNGARSASRRRLAM